MPIAVEVVPPYLQSIPSITPDILNDSHSKDIPEHIIDEFFVPIHDTLLKELGITNPESIQFDPKKHISFTPEDLKKTRKLTLDQLQVSKPHQEPITNVGVTDPFPLFTDEAVAIMRWEVLKKDTIQFGARYADNVNDRDECGDIDAYVRGHCKQYSPFTYAAWNHPETLKIISDMSEVELVSIYDYEVANTNISIKVKKDLPTEVEEVKPFKVEDLNAEDVKGSVSWHYDSPQMVCVLMLSDTTDMVGGETALQMGNGKVAVVPGPKRGHAAILQGRILKHIATRPTGKYTERIAQVGSFRPKDPMLENSFATTVRPRNLASSRYNDWYKDYVNYRLDVLSERIEVLRKDINDSIERGEKFDQLKTIDFLQKKIIEYVEHSYQEFDAVEDGVVPKPASYNPVKARW